MIEDLTVMATYVIEPLVHMIQSFVSCAFLFFEILGVLNKSILSFFKNTILQIFSKDVKVYVRLYLIFFTFKNDRN